MNHQQDDNATQSACQNGNDPKCFLTEGMTGTLGKVFKLIIAICKLAGDEKLSMLDEG
jgi:hypothetical protein